MEVDGWRLTPFDSAPPDARALLLGDLSAPSQTSAEAIVDVKVGHRFWLNLTHPRMTESKQYELELSAGGNRISHTLLDLDSVAADGQPRPVDIWMDGSGELGAVGLNSKASSTGVVGAWEWMGVDDDDDPLSSLGVKPSTSSGLSGALVLRLFSIASRKDGFNSDSQEPVPRAASSPDDRDASQVLNGFITAREQTQAGNDDSRRIEVDLFNRPQDSYSLIETPSSSHPLKPLRSSLKSIKPAAATFILGYRLAPFPRQASASNLVSTPPSIKEGASTATHGHPTPPSSVRNKMTPTSTLATYSRKELKKRARGARVESDSSASDVAEGNTSSQQEAYRPETPRSRGTVKPSSVGGSKASSTSTSKIGHVRTSSEPVGSASSKRRKTVPATRDLPETVPSVGSGTAPLSTPTFARRRTSSAGKGQTGSPTSGPGNRRQKNPSADPMQLVASGDEMDDEIQVVEGLSALPPAKQTDSLERSQDTPPPPESQRHRRQARQTPKSSLSSSAALPLNNPEENHQGLLDFGDGELFERTNASETVIDAEANLDDFVPAPDNLFSNERPAASSSPGTFVSAVITAGPSGVSTREVAIENQPTSGEEGDVDFAAFFAMQSVKNPAPVAGGSPVSPTAVLLASSAAGGNREFLPGAPAGDVKDEGEGHDSVTGAAAASPTEGKVEGSDEAHAPVETEDEDELPVLDRQIRSSIREVVEMAIAQGTKALTHEACKIDVDLLRRMNIDITPELYAIRDRVAQGCRNIIIAEALDLLPLLTEIPSEQTPANATLPIHMADMREALRRIVFNSTLRHETELFNRFQSVWDPSFPGDVMSIVHKQHDEIVQAMREKVAQALRANKCGV